MSNFLFICGCPQSGAGSLGRIISMSEEVTIGIERYSNLIQPKNFQLNEKLYEKERFFKVQKGDTFYDDFDLINKAYSPSPDKFDTAKYVGEKQSYLFKAYDELFAAFPEATVLFIYKDIMKVVNAYQNKVLSKAWSEQRDYQAAVKDWNSAMYLTSLAVEQDKNIICVDYNTIFRSSISLKKLFYRLDLKYTESIKKDIIKRRQIEKQLESKAEDVLNSEQQEYIEENYKSFLEELILPYNFFWQDN